MNGRVYTPAVLTDQSFEHIIRTRYGIEFDARDGSWPIDGNQSFDADATRALVSPLLLPGMEATLRFAATKYSWSTISQYRWALRHFQKTLFPDGAITSWELKDFRMYRTSLLAEFGHEDYLRHIRSLLVNWHRGRHPGVSEELIVSLKEMRLKGVEAGRAVRTMDPDEGPLTPEEAHHFLQDLADAAEAGRLGIGDFSLLLFHICTGRRPIQSANLKCMDVFEGLGDPEPAHSEGKPVYMLLVPRAKQKGHVFRETRRAIDLTLENFQVFQTQRSSVQHRFARLLLRKGWQLQPNDLKALLADLPLYPAWESVDDSVESATRMREGGEHGTALAALRLDAKGSAWHATGSDQGRWITEAAKKVRAFGVDGRPLTINAGRLRYTKGSGLAREGLPASLIAWLLDHSTSRSAEIYVDNLPEHAAQIDRAVSKSPTLQRFASAFRGTLVDSEADAIAGNDPRSRVAYRGKNAATCGHLKQCGLDGGIPRACYTCSHFQPWLDGPHEEFLAELEGEKATMVAGLGADSPVAKRHDKLIGAVQNVIHLCQVRRAELEGLSAAGGQA